MKDQDYCRRLTRVNGYKSRQRIQVKQVFQLMETKLNHLQDIVSGKGNTSGGSVCLEVATPINPVHVLENQPFQSKQGFFSDVLG